MMGMIRFFRNLLETNKRIIELIDLIEKDIEFTDHNNRILAELRDKLNEATITFERSMKGKVGFIWEDEADPPGGDQ